MTISDTVKYSAEDNFVETDVDMELLESDIYDEDNLIEESPHEIPKQPAAVISCQQRTVPIGWSLRGEGRFTVLTSPTGQTFKSRRAAFEYMVNSGTYSAKKINDMKSYLKHEGWEESDKLPVGWMLKKKKDRGPRLLGLGGELFESVAKAYEFVKKYKKYFRQEDLHKIQDMYEKTNFNKSLQRKNETHLDGTWGEGTEDNSFPKGWKFKNVVNGRFKYTWIVSPDGVTVKGRRSALRFMNVNKYPEKDISIMVNGMKLEGWKTDENLPQNWLFKARGGSSKFCSPDGKVFESKEKLFKYFKTIMSDVEVMKLKQKLLHGMAKSQNKTDQKKTLNIDKSWLEGCKENFCPLGWKFKIAKLGSTNITWFLSPEGVTIKGRRSALQYMSSKHYPESDLQLVRIGMTQDGWKTEEGLPKNWFYKAKHAENLSRINYCSPEGKLFETKEKLFKYVNLLEKMSNDDLMKLKRHKGNGKANLDDKSWIRDDPTVPSGWGIKIFNFGSKKRTRLMSPEGKIYNSKREALKLMIDEKYPEKEIEEMRNTLTHDGWLTDSNLPKDWFFKYAKGSAYPYFISPGGDKFKSSTVAIEYLKRKSQENDLKHFFTFLNSFKLNSDFTGFTACDQTMPLGWKYKSMSLGKERTFKVFLTQSGDQVKGKKLALKYVIHRGYSQSDIDLVRNSLREDGWQTSERLPSNWLWKYEGKRKNKTFIGPNGTFFPNKDNAVKHLKTQYLNAEANMISLF